jgi:hypothetical protein
MFEFIKKWFQSKEEEQVYPYAFIKVEVNKISLSKGIFDNFNREINIYENGELIESHHYTRELLESIKKVKDIPIYWETYDINEEEIEMIPFSDLEVIKYKRS